MKIIMKMRMSAIRGLALIGVASMLTNHAGAIIVGGAVTSGAGSFVQLTTPLGNPFGPANSVGNDTFQNPNLYGFNESQNAVVAAGGLTLNVVPAAAPGGGTGGGTITAGTIVASHYIFFDPQANSQEGWVQFDSMILGVLTLTDSLAASDYLANTGVNYLNPDLRGLEPGQDSAWVLTAQPNRVYVNWNASTPGDYIRVLTAFSPGAVPDVGSTLLLLGLSLAGLSVARRKLS